MTPQQRAKLATFRALLESTDDALIQLLSDRARLVDEVWAWKRAEGLPLTDPSRELELKRRLLARATSLGLDEAAIARILELVVGKKLSR